MTNYVMVHGAWHGSWCWKRVRRLLTARGQQVFTPTLTGLGERAHLLNRDVTLDTHIADVVNLLIWEDLWDVVLVFEWPSNCNKKYSIIASGKD